MLRFPVHCTNGHRLSDVNELPCPICGCAARQTATSREPRRAAGSASPGLGFSTAIHRSAGSRCVGPFASDIIHAPTVFAQAYRIKASSAVGRGLTPLGPRQCPLELKRTLKPTP